ncbi:cytidine deaminase [Salicibibacter halophilus]|uniref:Cytidine deaminase n=1 Tax=Salicibibacter halophilus TaxID=2502791 RepID=A0A514LEV4_9BACI|nr:cytidine deaminase [Salicibibacter halophilus]QDI89781.1 cytidine deaminase [Salicibibacter halophilus]
METLIQRAKEARDSAYVPYSAFPVGACAESDTGLFFQGCNIENASYGLSNCGERTAIFNAVSAGAKRLKKIAVIADTKAPVSPCGACRQVMAEFMVPEAEVVLANLKGDTKKMTVAELLPGAFEAGDMDE